MRCEDCKHYFRTLNFNSCAIMEAECFMTREDCDLVNSDGSINAEHPYYKTLEEDDKNRVFMFDF